MLTTAAAYKSLWLKGERYKVKIHRWKPCSHATFKKINTQNNVLDHNLPPSEYGGSKDV